MNRFFDRDFWLIGHGVCAGSAAVHILKAEWQLGAVFAVTSLLALLIVERKP